MELKLIHIGFALVLLINLAFSGCQKRCAQPGSRLQGLTTQQLRVVETSDSTIQVDNFNGPIYTFSNDFTMAINQLRDNRYYETPIYVGTYNIQSDGKSGTIRMTYHANSSGSTGSTGGSTGSTAGSSSGSGNITRQMSYEINAYSVDMNDDNSGDFYHAVEYTGQVLAADIGECSWY